MLINRLKRYPISDLGACPCAVCRAGLAPTIVSPPSLVYGRQKAETLREKVDKKWAKSYEQGGSGQNSYLLGNIDQEEVRVARSMGGAMWVSTVTCDK